MIKKFCRWLRYVFYCTTLNDLQEDVEQKKIDFNRYLTTVVVGTPMYRLVRERDDPVAPTGIGEGYLGCRAGHRWVSTSSGFVPERYRNMYYNNDSQLITYGTGATCLSLNQVTPFRENDDVQIMDFYKLTLKRDIRVVDLGSLCKALRIPTPLSEERHPVYHKFYGTHIQGVRFKCFKCNSASDELNIIIYNDWFKEFKDIVDIEKIDKDNLGKGGHLFFI